MYFFNFITSFILVTVLSLSSVECGDLNLTTFDEKAQYLLSEDAKNKVFNQNYESPEEIEKTLKILPKKFAEALGTSLNPCSVKDVNNAATKLLESHREDALSEAYDNAIANFLKELGKLNSSNVNQLVGKYVDELEKAAMAVPDDYSISDTFPVLVAAIGKFLKSEGVITKKDADRFIKILTAEIKKSTPKTATDDSSTTPKTMTDYSSATPKTMTDYSSTTPKTGAGDSFTTHSNPDLLAEYSTTHNLPDLFIEYSTAHSLPDLGTIPEKLLKPNHLLSHDLTL